MTITKKKSQDTQSFKNLDKKAVGQRVKLIRTSLGMNQKEFASSLTISAASLSDIETGKGIPRHDTIFQLSRKYKVNIYYLLHGEGEMFHADSLKRVIESGVYGNHTEFIKEFYRYICESPLVRYEMMGYFRTLLVEKDKLIEKDIRLYEKEKTEKEMKKRQ
jgi:transcriptional regulator with XRE-family HTH domain